MNEEYAKKIIRENNKGYELITDHFSLTRNRIWPEIKFLFEKYINPDDNFLDLGCGNGRFCEIVKNYTERYVGIDSCKGLIKIAKQKNPNANFIEASALNIPFPENYFDKIYSIAVLHHIPSKQLRLNFLKEIRRTLKPGKLCVLTVWEAKEKKIIISLLKFTFLKLFFLSKLDFGDMFLPWKNNLGENKFNRYYHFFSKKELINLFKEAGFSVRDVGIVRNRKGNHCNIYIVAEKGKGITNLTENRSS